VAYKGDIKASKVAGPKQSFDYVRLSRDFLINHITTTTQPKFVKLSSLSWCQQVTRIINYSQQFCDPRRTSITAPTNLHTRLVYDFKLDPAFRAGQVDLTFKIDRISSQESLCQTTPTPRQITRNDTEFF
jgi:hypothetical protein